jgi:transcriptional regulator with XRE-family HTH domain
VSENQRFAEYIKFKGLKQQEVAEMFDVSRQYINGIITGKDSMGMNLVRKLLDKFPDLNADWLLTGRGEMLIKDDSRKDYQNNKLDTIMQRLSMVEEKLSQYATPDNKKMKTPKKSNK